MANPDHLEILEQGVVAWNSWHRQQLEARNLEDPANLSKETLIFVADLSGVNLADKKLGEINLSYVDLSSSTFRYVDFTEANLLKSNLKNTSFDLCTLQRTRFCYSDLSNCSIKESTGVEADFADVTFKGIKLDRQEFYYCSFVRADFENCNLSKATFYGCDLRETNFSHADLSETDLSGSTLIKTQMDQAILNHCKVYGTSVWEIQGTIKEQNDLIITDEEDIELTVDEIEVAQFMYLIINNSKLRNVIDTITSKSVLILGRFYEERKIVLDAIKSALRKKGYLPILFDFKKPDSKSLTETVSTLAKLSKFVIADITDAKSVPQELAFIIPPNPSVPVVPIIDQAFEEYAMFGHFRQYPAVLPLHVYASKEELIQNIESVLIAPAEEKLAEKD